MPGILDATKFNVTLALLDSLANELGGSGFTLGTDNRGLFLLPGLVDEESGPLGFLLSYLFRFDSGSEFGGEGQML